MNIEEVQNRYQKLVDCVDYVCSEFRKKVISERNCLERDNVITFGVNLYTSVNQIKNAKHDYEKIRDLLPTNQCEDEDEMMGEDRNFQVQDRFGISQDYVEIAGDLYHDYDGSLILADDDEIDYIENAQEEARIENEEYANSIREEWYYSPYWSIYKYVENHYKYLNKNKKNKSIKYLHYKEAFLLINYIFRMIKTLNTAIYQCGGARKLFEYIQNKFDIDEETLLSFIDAYLGYQKLIISESGKDEPPSIQSTLKLGKFFVDYKSEYSWEEIKIKNCDLRECYGVERFEEFRLKHKKYYDLYKAEYEKNVKKMKMEVGKNDMD